MPFSLKENKWNAMDDFRVDERVLDNLYKIRTMLL